MTDPRFRSPELALTEQPAARAPAASAAARAFNLQLTRIQKLKSQLGALDTLAQQHREAVIREVKPLQSAHRAAMRDMVRQIDSQLAGKNLSAPLRAAATELLCSMAQTLAREGDAEMAALHDRHASVDLSAIAAQRAQLLRAEIEAALGEAMDDLPPDASEQVVLAAGRARLRQQEEDAAAHRAEASARKKERAGKKKPASAARQQAEAQQVQASDLLRSLFRRLASALHPDREHDAVARDRKTRLMSEANAAYARKDLVALMELQQAASLIDPDARADWADDKLVAMTVLLKGQVADLERERAGRQDALCHEFQLPYGAGVTPGTLQRVLLEQIEELEMALQMMAHDLRLAQTDTGFKRWLKQQQAVARRFAR
jgi:hypothetical protein